MNVKLLFLSAATLCMLSTGAFAQKKKKVQEAEPEGYKFETVLQNPITSIKNQSSSGTCWVFSCLSFFESEIMKAGGDSLDLSEMFVVSKAYGDKAEKFVRLHGALNFGGGSSFGDVLEVMKTYGMVPNTEMTGLNYGEDRHVHGELDAVLDAYVRAIVENPNRKLSTAWRAGYQGILDAYLGTVPETFTYKGKQYTPKSFEESFPIDLNDYVDLTSFTHHPFYQPMIIEVPDNWRWETAYNVPIDDITTIIDNALKNGYTVAWASDVSEKGFTRDGIGVVPDDAAIAAAAAKEAGSDQAHWIGKDPKSADNSVPTPGPELEITQEMRQAEFDNYKTTDDHGMHIYGIAKDQNGTEYYMVKNSWGEAGAYKGFWYVSKAFVRFKTTDFMVNKNALPSDIRAKLGL